MREPLIFDTDVEHIPDAAQVGGKACGLWRLRDAGLVVPRFAVIPVDAVTTVMAGAHEQALAELLQQLGGTVAVRSSAIDEDGATHSFAGQHHTTLGVSSRADLNTAIAACVASFSSTTALAYRRAQGLTSPATGAVVVQRLVQADVAGVAFSRDPHTGADVVTIAACLGLGEGVVADRAPADTFVVDGAGVIRRDIAHKDVAVRATATGTALLAVEPEHQGVAALDDDALQELARVVRRLGADGPVDVEWTWTRAAGFAFVQLRPLTTTTTTTTTPERAPPITPTPTPTPRYLFDTSNIGESYPGVTSPLTWSHIRLAYAVAYEQSARLCGVDEQDIAEHHRAFATLLARIDGRVHYHLPSWFQILALYPGYEQNRRAMLEMMGADAVSTSIPAPPSRSLWRQASMYLRMGRVLLQRRRLVAAFTASIETTLQPLEATVWQDVDADDVVALWHDVRHRLLRGWQAPLLADFLAMVSHSTLRRFCARYGLSDVVAELFSGDELAGVAPTRALAALARRIRGSTIRTTFVAASPSDALALVRNNDDVGPAFVRFIATFGARAMHELKLEQPTWADDPAFVVRQLQDLVRHGEGPAVVDGAVRSHLAEVELRARLPFLARALFRLLVEAARTWMGHRERMRYARARTFAVLRSLALRLGDVLVQANVLDDRRDVFWLEHDELTGVFDGTATSYDLRGLVALRRREDARSQQAAPPDRVAFAQGVILGSPLSPSTPAAHVPTDGVLHGTSVMGGVARGPVRLVTCADDAHDVAGHVLVCPRTDPGFAALFPAARALVVERGSPLSHCAIVARELGLPTIVNVRGIVELVQARPDVVLVVDGTAGTTTTVGGT